MSETAGKPSVMTIIASLGLEETSAGTVARPCDMLGRRQASTHKGKPAALIKPYL